MRIRIEVNCCGSAFIFADPDPAVFLNADPDPDADPDHEPAVQNL